MEKKTIVVKKAESEEELNALNSFCQRIYHLADGEQLKMPDSFFGAHIDNQIVGTVGLFTKRGDKLLPTEKICGVNFTEDTYEVARLSWIKGLTPLKLDLIIGSLIYGIYNHLERKINGINSFVGIVKPSTLNFMKRLLGKNTFVEIPYKEINEESISPASEKIFYLTLPRPVIFQTDCQRAGERVKELLFLLNTKIRPVNLGA